MAHQDVFISYSRPDAEAARLLVGQLEAHDGIACWYAGRDVPAGTDWAGAIVRAIGEARAMVLIFSAAANISQQVRREVMLAMERGVRVVPFRIADVTPSESLEYFLSGQQWIDAFPPPLEPHCTRLITCLDSISPKIHISTAAVVDPDDSSAENRPAPGVKPSPPHSTLTIESAKLQRLEYELASYIGPYAKWKVDCIASEANDMGALIDSLSGEIDNAKDRTKFVSTCRKWLE